MSNLSENIIDSLFNFLGGANTLPSLHLQALRELSYYVLFHFYKLNNNESTDAEKNLRNAKFFLKSMDLFHIHVIDFVSDPYLLLFVAECFIVEDEYPEQSIEEYLEQIMPDIFQALFFLTGFFNIFPLIYLILLSVFICSGFRISQGCCRG